MPLFHYFSIILLRVTEDSSQAAVPKTRLGRASKCKESFWLALILPPLEVAQLICNSNRAFCAVFQHVAQRIFHSLPEASSFAARYAGLRGFAAKTSQTAEATVNEASSRTRTLRRTCTSPSRALQLAFLQG